MKRIIRASKEIDIAKRILDAGRKLMNELDDAPRGFVDANDLAPLYDELIETLPALDFMIRSGDIDSGSLYDN